MNKPKRYMHYTGKAEPGDLFYDKKTNRCYEIVKSKRLYKCSKDKELEIIANNERNRRKEAKESINEYLKNKDLIEKMLKNMDKKDAIQVREKLENTVKQIEKGKKKKTERRKAIEKAQAEKIRKANMEAIKEEQKQISGKGLSNKDKEFYRNRFEALSG